MSAPAATPKGRKKPAPRQEKRDMDPSELMRAMGGNGWFNPESNDMIRVLRQLARSNAIPRPVILMYAWMKWQTLTSENRQPYANRKGIMLYLKDMADELGIEICNCRMYWRIGVKMGLWRNGDAQKGESAEGLYLCAKVAIVDAPEDPEKPPQVCTYLQDDFLKKFKPYIREKLEQLPAESLEQFAARWDRLEEIGECAHADLLATVRAVVGQNQDTLIRELGVEKKRLDTAKNKSAEELAEAAARQARIDTLLLPHVQRYVQTLSDFVPTSKPGLSIPENGLVHTSENGAKNGALPAPIPQLYQGVADDAAPPPKHPPSLLEPVRNSQKERRAGVSDSPVRSSGVPPILDGQESVQQHAGDSRTLASATVEERENAERLLVGIGRLQQEHPTKFVGDEVSPESRADMATAVKMVRTVGIAEVPAFVLEVEQRAIDRALGYSLSIALISEIAGDFARGKSKREQARRQAAAQESKREALAKAAAATRQRDDELFERTEQAWEALPVAERMERLKKAGAELKADPHWSSAYRNASERQRREQTEIRAKRKLRGELEARP